MAKDISGLIRELLLKHDCVIIPGFGAFIGNYFPARVDRKEGLFEPPSRKITFNRHLTGNDGLLIGHVSSVRGVGYGEARDIVNDWSAELRSRIMSGHPVTIDLLGTFSLNYEHAIVFEPDLTVNYLLSSYGLSAYHRKPVSGFDVRKMAIERRHEHSVSQPSMRTLLTRAAVIIPVLVALALVPFNDRIFRSNIEESNLNPLAKAELEFNREQIDADRSAAAAEVNITAEDSATGKTVNEMKSSLGLTVPETKDVAKPVVTEAKVVIKPAVTETVTTPAVNVPAREAAPDTSVNRAPVRRPTAVVVEDYRFMVIIGSFRGEDNALIMVEKLRRLGYDPEVAGGPDGFLRVSAQAFPTLDEAKVVLDRLKKDFPGAWVFKTR
ncbi:MAG: SPOR domain-containing protein [Bacteroidota bacterium]|nr:SPOR domain-containing protein [Bacteroidota bacterium]